jgi:hypothetical protein
MRLAGNPVAQDIMEQAISASPRQELPLLFT